MMDGGKNGVDTQPIARHRIAATRNWDSRYSLTLVGVRNWVRTIVKLTRASENQSLCGVDNCWWWTISVPSFLFIKVVFIRPKSDFRQRR